MLRLLQLLSVFFLVMSASSAFAASLTEQQKFDILLKSFDDPGISIVKDGKPYSAIWARKYLLNKMKTMTPPVTTAEEFIKRVARTSDSGKPYMVKLKDGRTIRVARWLKRKLANINKAAANFKPPPPQEDDRPLPPDNRP